jgi:carnitine O-acetyltransferase
VEWSTGTFGNEDRLPRVPLPSLAHSCERFLEWCAPLLTPAQLEATAAELVAFQQPDGAGAGLQAALERYNDSEGVHSWLDTFWPRRYLGRRDRIALNANFFFLFRDTGQSQLERAAGLIAAALDYKRRLDHEEIPPIIQRGQALSMVQHKYLFSETRIPGPVQDSVRVPYSPQWPGPSRERHIVVFFHGNAVRMEVLAEDGSAYTMDDLVAGLRAVMTAAGVRPSASVGHLTTKARAEWAASRDALLAAGNAAALDTIETALFCVCLEDRTPDGTLDTCDQLLHGDSGNRWFDKAVSFIVFPDGQAGINVEHCGLDGTTILSFVDTLLTTPVPAGPSRGAPPIASIDFTIDDDLRADIAAAAGSFADFAAATESSVVEFDGFGADTVKQLGMSPDAFVQMAYQLAHRRSNGFIGATYESIATRHWQHGRTEAMRVVTPEVLAFVSIMDDPEADPAVKRAAFRAAAQAHVVRAQQCQAGDAPEQHLWELQLIALRRGEASPPLFATPGWLVMRDDYLSTSSAPSTNIQFFGFGSTSSHCIGVAYVLLPDRFNLYLSTPRAVGDEMQRFAEQLRRAVSDLTGLLEVDRSASLSI